MLCFQEQEGNCSRNLDFMYFTFDDAGWERLSDAASERAECVAHEVIETLWQKIPEAENYRSIQRKSLPFYKTYSLYRVSQLGYRPYTWRYYLASDVEASRIGEAQEIYKINRKAPLSLSRDNVEDYALFLLPRLYAHDIDSCALIGAKSLAWPKEATQAQIEQFHRLAHPPRFTRLTDHGAYELAVTALNQKTRTLIGFSVQIDAEGVLKEIPASRRPLLDDVSAYRMSLR